MTYLDEQLEVFRRTQDMIALHEREMAILRTIPAETFTPMLELEALRRERQMVPATETFTPMLELEALRRERREAALCALGYVT